MTKAKYVSVPDPEADHLYPAFNALLQKVIEQAKAETAGKYPGLHDIRIYEGYRSAARQEWLYAQGRSRPGSVVTNDRIPRRHGLGLAADIVGYDEKGQPSWNWPKEFWQQLGHAARAHGLEWGGDWPSFPDEPHIQANKLQQKLWKAEAKAYLHAKGLTTPNL